MRYEGLAFLQGDWVSLDVWLGYPVLKHRQNHLFPIGKQRCDCVVYDVLKGRWFGGFLLRSEYIRNTDTHNFQELF